MGVQSCPDRRSPERDLAEPRQRVAHPRDALAHLRRVSRELLSERDGHRVHPVRASRLDDVVELAGLGLERRRERLERGKQFIY
jgi:hypothetical protein